MSRHQANLMQNFMYIHNIQQYIHVNMYCMRKKIHDIFLHIQQYIHTCTVYDEKIS